MKKCEACGCEDFNERILVRTTNGALTLCRQCLDDINRKNPEVKRLQKQIEGHCERIAKQSELLSKRAEVTS